MAAPGGGLPPRNPIIEWLMRQLAQGAPEGITQRAWDSIANEISQAIRRLMRNTPQGQAISGQAASGVLDQYLRQITQILAYSETSRGTPLARHGVPRRPRVRTVSHFFASLFPGRRRKNKRRTEAFSQVGEKIRAALESTPNSASQFGNLAQAGTSFAGAFMGPKGEAVSTLIGNFVGAITSSIEALNKWSKQVTEEALQLKYASPGMTLVDLQKRYGQMLIDFYKGEKLWEAAQKKVQAELNRARATAPAEVEAEKAQLAASSEWEKTRARFWLMLQRLFVAPTIEVGAHLHGRREEGKRDADRLRAAVDQGLDAIRRGAAVPLPGGDLPNENPENNPARWGRPRRFDIP